MKNRESGNPDMLTARQREVWSMRYERGATIEQIAAWLHISRRAVLFRLHNARRRARGVLPLRRGSASPARKKRLYSASQISGGAAAEKLNIDAL